ncbi:MAG: hypothetical protein GX362_06445 [Methanosarcinaceae archaeon]|nr:hypothetical protein [Methanosarcinaceae archaeon]
MKDTIIFLINVLFTLIVVSVFAYFPIRYIAYRNYVKRSSVKLKEIEFINNKYLSSLSRYDEKHSIKDRVDTKYKFDNYRYDIKLNQLVIENKGYIIDCLERI